MWTLLKKVLKCDLEGIIDNMVYITYYINVNIQKRRFEDMFQVEFYEKEDGDIPVEKFFKQFRT